MSTLNKERIICETVEKLFTHRHQVRPFGLGFVGGKQ